jgi:hypothetical protein
MLIRTIAAAIMIVMMGTQLYGLPSYATSNFKIHYEQTIPAGDIRKLGNQLEAEFDQCRRKLGITPASKFDVTVYNSGVRFRRDSKSLVFDDGCWVGGKIYLMAPKVLNRTRGVQLVVSRVVARALLGELPLCPAWLSECYSLYAGNDVTRFGKPAQVKVSGFADVGEMYATAEREKELHEVYATLAVTADFLIARYGERRVEGMFLAFRKIDTVEEAFQSAFGEKISEIEKSWIDTLRLAVKE